MFFEGEKNIFTLLQIIMQLSKKEKTMKKVLKILQKMKEYN